MYSPPSEATQQPSHRCSKQCIVTVSMLIVLVTLPAALWGVVSTRVVAAAGPHVDLNDTVCEKHTGGTCFFARCAAARNAVCSHTWSNFHWHECNCHGGLCAGVDGMCHGHSSPRTIESRFRKEASTLFLMIAVMVGRSGLYTYVLEKTGLDRVIAVRDKVTTTLLTKGTDGGCGLTPFDELVAEQKLSTVQVVLVCTLKLLLWHMSQVIFFWSAWLAYRQFMGWWQFFFATVVALKEAGYLVVLVVAIVQAPHFLLYAPSSAPAGRVLYSLSPCWLVATVVSRVPGKDWLLMVFLPVVSLELAGTPSAWIALGVGLWGQGVMFPSLFLGYLLTGLSWLGFIHWGVVDTNRL